MGSKSMGCDIHAVIEFENFSFVSAFTKGELNLPRDYQLFSAIALGDCGITDNLLFKPRGLPLDCSFEVRDLFFVEAEEAGELWLEMGEEEEFDPQEYAERFGAWSREEYKASGRVPNLELHGASWLNLKELAEALEYGKIEVEKLSAEFRAVLAAMRVLSEQYNPEKVRLVFWFDGAG